MCINTILKKITLMYAEEAAGDTGETQRKERAHTHSNLTKLVIGQYSPYIP